MNSADLDGQSYIFPDHGPKLDAGSRLECSEMAKDFLPPPAEAVFHSDPIDANARQEKF